MPASSKGGASDPETLSSQRKLAADLIKDNQCSRAEALLRQILPSIGEQYGEHSPQNVSCHRDLIRAVECQLREDEVKKMIKEARTRIDDMKQSQFGREQRMERQWLERIETDMEASNKALTADINERLSAVGSMGSMPFRNGNKR